MRRAKIIEHPNSDLLSGNTDLLEAYRFYCLSGGEVSARPDHFEEIIDSLQIFAPAIDGSPYFHCGHLSTTGRVYGADFAANLAGKTGLPDKDYDRAVSAQYYDVFVDAVPRFHKISARINIRGLHHTVVYDRILFPIKFSSAVLVACATSFVSDLGELIAAARGPTDTQTTHLA